MVLSTVLSAAGVAFLFFFFLFFFAPGRCSWDSGSSLRGTRPASSGAIARGGVGTVESKSDSLNEALSSGPTKLLLIAQLALSIIAKLLVGTF